MSTPKVEIGVNRNIVLPLSREEALLLGAFLAVARTQQIHEIAESVPVSKADLVKFRDGLHAGIVKALQHG